MFKFNTRNNDKIVTYCVILPVLLILSFIASSPLSLHSWFNGFDSLIHLIRSNDVCYEISIGNYYPRWLSQACFGKGLPTLNFYSPAFYLLVGYLNAAGFPIITSIVIICFSSFFLGAWGMYLWTRKYCGETGALIAASIYVFAPFHLADIYLRSALPEFIALAMLPYLFHAIDLSLSSGQSFRGYIYCALTSSAIVLTHNLTALMIFPFALSYFIWCYSYSKASPGKVISACFGFSLGAGLSSFYWAPVILETRYLLNLNSMKNGSFYFAKNFMSISEFFGSKEFGMHTYNSLYAVLFICIVVSITALITYKGIQARFGHITIILGFISILMTFAISMPVYKLIPAFQYLQFPWRFLGPATLFLSAFCGLIPHSKLLVDNKRIAVAACCTIMILCVYFSGDLRKVKGPSPNYPSNPVAFSLKSYPIFTSTADSDFMPIDSRLSRGDFIEFPWLYNNKMQVPLTDCRKTGSHLSCRVAVSQVTDLVAPWLYFPGWKATTDKVLTPVYPSKDGLVTLTIPQGEHDIELWFGTTWPRIAGWVTAAISLAIMVSSIVLHIYRSRRPSP